ncbi:aminotransferase class I/II-fold pyridoxal phosphate-dependent enzyme [Corynebacterium poyangense]|uniref:Aminotransferase class I/II-fold pyridoxal phosphate-dependent enzyme n=1 Tax=Corynebacterium poyangense TaxID=2684405 RepID=A0A7H0SN85_9CORY|nr:DegT/DnrJ/EryC1/StrS family aminotransferase [Corynebacterium poyangense]QNQ90010.1 aminotransferase class I/II-fold pyridoxal phosphate-dependent enzyme [Corynebacterium poyangense]
MSRIPFAKPDITEKEVQAAADAIRSGWVTTGENAEKFETEFAQYLGSSELQCVAVNSATAALHLAVEALGIGPGDEVLVPTWTFTSTAEVVRYVGADPVLVDSNPNTYLMSLEDAETKVSPMTKAIIPVHFAGLPVNRDALNKFAHSHQLKVIEDAAHSLPTMSGGRMIGDIQPEDATEAVCFSFYATKTMTTGEGGMLVTRNKALARRAKTMRLHGISRDVFDRYSSLDASWFYEVIAPGFKYNLGDIAAAIGRVQLGRLDEMTARRTEIARRLTVELDGLPIKLPVQESEARGHSWHLYAIQILSDSRVDRDTFIQVMRENEIGCSVHFIPLHKHPYYKQQYSYKPEEFPVAEECFRKTVSLPIYSSLSDDEVTRIIETIKKIVV